MRARRISRSVRTAELRFTIERVQRKIVTVLFCDVVGSTALGESVDAEATRSLLARFFVRDEGDH